MIAKEIFKSLDLSKIDKELECIDTEINIKAVDIEIETLKGVNPKQYYYLSYNVIGEGNYNYEDDSISVNIGIASVVTSSVFYVEDEEFELDEEVCIELDSLLEKYIRSKF